MVIGNICNGMGMTDSSNMLSLYHLPHESPGECVSINREGKNYCSDKKFSVVIHASLQ